MCPRRKDRHSACQQMQHFPLDQDTSVRQCVHEGMEKREPLWKQSLGTFSSYVLRTFAVCSCLDLDGKTVYPLWKL